MHIRSRAEEQTTLDRDASPRPDRDVAIIAFHLWMERGCPIGSPDEDWFQAEAALKSRVQADAATA